MYNNTSWVSVNLTHVGAPKWTYIALGIVPLWILGGNLLVLLAVLWQKNLRTLSNLVIASLAATDFLLAVCVVPLGTYQVINGRWELGFIMCLCWTGIDIFLSTTSIMHLCAIAIHRYLAIAYPLRFRTNQSKRRVVVLLAPAWIVSFCLAIPHVVEGIFNQENVILGFDDFSAQCGIFDQKFTIYSSVVSFFLPLTVMLFADIRSIKLLRDSTKVSFETGHLPHSPDTMGETALDIHLNDYDVSDRDDFSRSPTCTVEITRVSSDQDLVFLSTETTPQSTPQSESLPHVRHKHTSYLSMLANGGIFKVNSRERRAEKTLLWVFVCFVVLWLPFFVTNITYGICTTCNIPSDVFLAFTWLGYISSGVNPCIYTFLNKDFRNAFKNILLCQWLGKRCKGRS